MRVESEPPGVEVRLPDNRVVSTPAIVKVRYNLFRRAPLVVSAPGYRTLTLDLCRRRGPGLPEINLWRVALYPVFHPFAGLRREPLRRLDFVMVPEHGPAGTWDPTVVPIPGE